MAGTRGMGEQDARGGGASLLAPHRRRGAMESDTMKTGRALLDDIKALPDDFHEAGVMVDEVLDAIYNFCDGEGVEFSAETGSGKTTLLLSNLCSNHTVFTLGAYGELPCASYDNVVASPLFNATSTEFVLGPTQRTLPQYTFPHGFQFVLLDGPMPFPSPASSTSTCIPRWRRAAVSPSTTFTSPASPC